MVLDPIVDEVVHILDDQFKAGKVSGFLANPNLPTGDPSRHYSQTVTFFDKSKVERAMRKLGIPMSGHALIFGGYTGQFAACLKDLGMSVIFTDPMVEWATRATAAGYESYKLSAEEIPGRLLERSQLVATFECYMPFSNDKTFLYNGLRFLTTEFGIIFGESKRTREQMASEESGRMKQLKSSMTPFKKVYGIDIRSAEAADIRLYSFKALTLETRSIIKRDCQVIKHVYDTIENQALLDRDTIDQVSTRIGLEPDDVSSSVERFYQLYRANILSYGAVARYLPYDEFWIFSKRYKYSR